MMPGQFCRIRGYLLGALLASGLIACDSTSPDEYVERARLALQKHDLTVATIEIKNALQETPDHLAARRMLGEIHLEKGDYAAAVKELERAYDLGAAYESIEPELLRSKLGLGRYQEVIGGLGPREKLAPGLQTLLAEAYRQSGDLAKAKPLFETAIEADAKQSYAYLGLGLIAWYELRLDDALAMLGSAVSADPRNLQAWFSKGEVELLKRDFSAAARSFEQATVLPGSGVQGRLGLARVALVKGDLDSASRTIDEVIQIAPKSPMAHYLRGLVLLKRDDLDGVDAALRQVQSLVPEHPPTRFLMAVAKYRQGQLSQAKLNLRQYLDQVPDSEPAGMLLASILLQEGDHKGVIEVLGSIEKPTRDPQLLALLATSYFASGRTSEATELLTRAVDLAPDAEVLRNQLVVTLMATDQRDLAVAELQESMELGIGGFASDYIGAMIHLREANYDDAEAVVKRIMQNNPDQPVGYNLLAAVHLARNDLDAAVGAFERALVADPGFLPAVVNLARMHELEGDFGAAENRYQAFIAANENNVAAKTQLARLVYRQNDYERAETILANASEADPEALEPKILLGRIHLIRGNFEAAEQAALKATGLAPDNVDALLLRGRVFLVKGDREGAARIARQLQHVLPQRMETSSRFNLGLFQVSAGQVDLGRQQFVTILAETDSKHLGALVNLTRIQIAAGELSAARAGVDMLATAGVDPRTRQLLEADLAVANGNLDQALGGYARLAKGGLREAMLKHNSVATRMQRFQHGREILTYWLERHTPDIQVELLLAENFTLDLDPAQAISRYLSILERFGDQAVALNNLAWLFLEQKDKRAEAMARRALALAPDSPALDDTLGWILLDSGQIEEALRHLTRAARLSPRNPSIKYHFAVALQRSGDSAGAKRALQNALELADFPEKSAAISLLQQID